MTESNTIRLQKFLADCGLGSRRACEKLITAGVVSVDGKTVTELGTKIDPTAQRISCNGKPVAKEASVTLLVNKPVKIICTSNDPQGRTTVLDLLTDLPERVYTVGRLDFMSEGLLIVTNDGDLAHALTHPRYHVPKTYRVRVNRPIGHYQLQKMVRGIPSQGETLKMLNIEEDTKTRRGNEYIVTLGEGRNRHIRRMMEFFDLKVIQLKRTAIGPLRLEKLKPGEWRRAKPSELKLLRKAISDVKRES